METDKDQTSSWAVQPMNSKIPDFTESELWVIQTTLKERYGKEVRLEQVEVELRLNPEDRQVTPCPAVFWSERSANFVLAKIGEKTYRAQFYYRGFEQYGTGRDVYDDLMQCIVTLLQVQADHERKRAESPPEPQAGAKPQEPTDSDINYSPLFWGD